jgi:hypothetical protein
MKKILLTSLFIFSFMYASNAQKCEKFFKKQKNNSSSVFGENQTVISKWIRFYNEGARKMYIQFTNMNNKGTLIIQQQTTINFQFKQPIELGRLIRIALIFENGKNYIIQFESSQENLGDIYKYEISRNSIDIPKELNDLLQNSTIKSIEIQNPFSSSNINADKILTNEAENAEKINMVYKCFLNKIIVKPTY